MVMIIVNEHAYNYMHFTACPNNLTQLKCHFANIPTTVHIAFETSADAVVDVVTNDFKSTSVSREEEIHESVIHQRTVFVSFQPRHRSAPL